MHKNEDCKVTQTVEDRWDWLGGSSYDGIHSTPDYTYLYLGEAQAATTYLSVIKRLRGTWGADR